VSEEEAKLPSVKSIVKKTNSVLSYAKEMVDVDIEQDKLNKKRSSIKDGLMGAVGDLVLKKK